MIAARNSKKHCVKEFLGYLHKYKIVRSTRVLHDCESVGYISTRYICATLSQSERARDY